MGSCDDKASKTTGQVMWTDKTTTYIFRPGGAAEDSANVKEARGTIEVQDSSGAFKAKVAYRYSNDGITWDAAVALYSPEKAQTNNGTAYGETLVDITSGRKDRIQFGALVANSTGSTTEIAYVILKIDKKR